MRITEKQLKKIIREELIRVDEGFSDWARQAAADVGSGAIAGTISAFVKVKAGAIDQMIPLFKATTTEAEAVAAMKAAVDGPYKGDASALVEDTIRSIPDLYKLAGAVKPFVNNMNSNIPARPITAALKYLKTKRGQDPAKLNQIVDAIKELVKRTGATLYNDIVI